MQNQSNSAFPLMISVVVMSAEQLQSVYALLGGVSAAALTASPGKQQRVVQSGDNAQPELAASAGQTATAATIAPSSDAIATVAGDDGEVDAHGHPWSAELHASTKGKTKDGLWRMKVGVTRPDPKPGFPIESGAASAGTGTSAETPPPSATSQTAPEPASAPAATSAPEEDDEFAAFRNAAAASVPARTYSDADLGALCNQAAVKLGDPSPIKEIITQYVPEGVVAHSRNIPEDKRAEFVKAVEEKAGIEFVG